MTTTAQRAAVARREGWLEVRGALGRKDVNSSMTWLPPYTTYRENIMEAVVHLEGKRRHDFFTELSKLAPLGTRRLEVLAFEVVWWALTEASPAQLCEAYLRCLGLWKEEV